MFIQAFNGEYWSCTPGYLVQIEYEKPEEEEEEEEGEETGLDESQEDSVNEVSFQASVTIGKDETAQFVKQ